MPSETPVGEGLVARRVRLPRRDVAWIRFVLEGHDGLALLHGTGDGTITLIAPVSRAAELDEVLADLGLAHREQTQISVERLVSQVSPYSGLRRQGSSALS